MADGLNTMTRRGEVGTSVAVFGLRPIRGPFPFFLVIALFLAVLESRVPGNAHRGVGTRARFMHPSMKTLSFAMGRLLCFARVPNLRPEQGAGPCAWCKTIGHWSVLGC